MFVSSENDPNYLTVVAHLRLTHKSILSHPPGPCLHEVCHPKCDPTCAYNVYICDYGKIHLCSEQSCKLFGSTPTLTCPISGQQMGNIVSNYNKDDARTWYNKGTEGIDSSSGQLLKKRKKKQTTNTEVHIKNAAETIIINLLYSNARKEHNEASKKKYTEEATMAMNTYALRRKTKMNQMAYKSDLYRIYSFYMTQFQPLKEMTMDMNVVRYYSEIVWQVWQICVKYHIHPNQRVFNEQGDEIKNRLTPEVVILGVLYSLRQGLSVSDIPVLPKDEFLENLPYVNNYTLFGIDKTKVTRGLNVLLQSYNNAVSLGVDSNNLLLNVTRLPPKTQHVGGLGTGPSV